ncbi:hypothetical protein IF1G_06778 [Cordyceps javanica]|uniref:Uncharacterized protein n=1 Tax=Cordyceps javanica TaxID=43265 RepID=A0A545UZ84_9HYPO|nr:hypothetical protein IF1G_06778 [Cordyceps javanica]
MKGLVGRWFVGGCVRRLKRRRRAARRWFGERRKREGERMAESRDWGVDVEREMVRRGE